jgi:predicted RNA binding protein YcfA (HicA-like mRNA interferase family)
MDSLPVIKPREAINALLRSGFYLHHQTGSHSRLVHKTMPDLKVTVPIHSKDIPKGTLRRTIRQAGLTIVEFLQLLDQ